MPRVRRLGAAGLIVFALPGTLGNAFWWGNAIGQAWSVALLVAGLFLLTIDLWWPTVHQWLTGGDPNIGRAAIGFKKEAPATAETTRLTIQAPAPMVFTTFEGDDFLLLKLDITNRSRTAASLQTHLTIFRSDGEGRNLLAWDGKGQAEWLKSPVAVAPESTTSGVIPYLLLPELTAWLGSDFGFTVGTVGGSRAELDFFELVSSRPVRVPFPCTYFETGRT